MTIGLNEGVIGLDQRRNTWPSAARSRGAVDRVLHAIGGMFGGARGRRRTTSNTTTRHSRLHERLGHLMPVCVGHPKAFGQTGMSAAAELSMNRYHYQNRRSSVVDLGFGDSGKGTMIDYLARRHEADMVVRFNGGPQAGHNVVLPDGRHHTFSQFGSGSFVPGVRTLLSHYMLDRAVRDAERGGASDIDRRRRCDVARR